MTDVEGLKRRWKKRWEAAKRTLELAAIHVKQVEQANPSREAYRQALEAEILAAPEYTKILRIYTDLVVRGELPQEEQTAKSES